MKGASPITLTLRITRRMLELLGRRTIAVRQCGPHQKCGQAIEASAGNQNPQEDPLALPTRPVI
jgi:hypothetical protein